MGDADRGVVGSALKSASLALITISSQRCFVSIYTSHDGGYILCGAIKEMLLNLE